MTGPSHTATPWAATRVPHHGHIKPFSWCPPLTQKLPVTIHPRKQPARDVVQPPHGQRAENAVVEDAMEKGEGRFWRAPSTQAPGTAENAELRPVTLSRPFL